MPTFRRGVPGGQPATSNAILASNDSKESWTGRTSSAMAGAAAVPRLAPALSSPLPRATPSPIQTDHARSCTGKPCAACVPRDPGRSHRHREAADSVGLVELIVRRRVTLRLRPSPQTRGRKAVSQRSTGLREGRCAGTHRMPPTGVRLMMLAAAHATFERALARGSFCQRRADKRAGARDAVWSVSRGERGDEGPLAS